MVATSGDYASTSYGLNPTIYYGRVENIKDPHQRNRCQVRMFGYEDDKGNIPNEKLEWLHASSTSSSQMHGDTQTQPYYPGCQVMILEIGTERYIMGSVPGFDSSKKLQNNPDGVDSSADQHPDVPNNQDPKNGTKETNSNIRAPSESIMPKGSENGLTQYPDYSKWPATQQLTSYAKGTGGAKSPWNKGLQAQYSEEQTIGHDRTQKGSDVLDVIKQKDGNQSGVIKQSIDIAKSLMKSQQGSGAAMIGNSLQNQADQEYMKFFGNQIHTDILSLLRSLKQVKDRMAGLTPQTFIDAVDDNSASFGVASFQNVTLGVSQSYIDNMYAAIDSIRFAEAQV